MEFLTKFFVISALSVVTYGRSLSLERNISNYSEEDSNNCSCNWRYLKHYEAKGCIVEEEDSCGCPKKFNCIFNETLHAPLKVCIYQNKEYKVGSKIITTDVCKVCRCHEGIPPYISCINKDCPQIEHISDKECHLVYNENKCCPVGQECFDIKNETEVTSDEIDIKNETEVTSDEIFTCEYNDKLYPFGAKIYPIDDPCQICLCNKNWSGIDNTSCYQQECVFEKDKSKLNEGCIPVYHENKCCPIEFYCPSSFNTSYTIISNNETTESNITSENNELCYFGGQFYELGMDLYNENPCVKCSCLVPPDFTCVHQSCPAPPNYENCHPVYDSGKCCPAYECLFGDAEPFPVPDGCPTPLCADSSCHIEIPSGHECPTCVCDDRSSFLEQNTVQQVQQIGQDMEALQHEFEGAKSVVDDYSEDELQMLPIKTQDTGGQVPVLEKMILPDSEASGNDSNHLAENLNQTISSEEKAVNINNETREIAETSALSLNSSELNTAQESNSSESEKNVQKRSNLSYLVAPVHHQRNMFARQQEGVYNKDIEREFDSSGKNGEDFDDELESFKNKKYNSSGTSINEITDTNPTDVVVPPGCPTPMCEGPWCKIGIPVGDKCPTCICRRPTGEP